MVKQRASLAIISGLDPGGGAGFLADAHTAAAFGYRPVGVVTALTEQDTMGVRAVTPVDAEVLSAQLTTLLSDVEVAAVKIGMLASEAITKAVADALALTAAPVVWDPVLLPTAGNLPLYRGDLQRAQDLLADHYHLVTPNLREAETLTSAPVTSCAEMAAAARTLCVADHHSALVTGGHLDDQQDAVDLLATGGEIIELRHRRIEPARAVHGTGCLLSTAIACGLGEGQSVHRAVVAAKEYLTDKLAAGVMTPGRGIGSLV